MTPASKHGLTALAAGLTFGAGLAIGGMTQPQKVIGFLDFGGRWDPSLAFVMAGAVLVHALAYRWIRGRASPLFADVFALPTKTRLDPKLIAGSALFGVGWGLAGYCPGPGIASLGAGSGRALVFVLALVAGTLLGSKLEAWLGQRRSARRDPAAPATGSA